MLCKVHVLLNYVYMDEYIQNYYMTEDDNQTHLRSEVMYGKE